MKKEQFLRDLGLRLSSLPYADKKRSLDFYSEMIDDRIEDGISEEEAVKKMGTPAFAAEKILTDLPITTLARARVRGSRSTFSIVMIILASPIWISLLAAAFSIVVSVFAALFSILAVIFSLIVTLWALEAAFALGGAAGIITCPLAILFAKNMPLAFMMLGGGFVLIALAIFLYYGAIYATKGLLYASKGVLKLSGLICRFIKFCLIRKEAIR